MDSSNSKNEEVNYAFMTITEDNVTLAATPTNNVHNTLFDFDINNISELKSFLKSLQVSFTSQDLKNTRLLSEISDLNKKNDFLEVELVLILDQKGL